jgi:hypothetical protein
LQILEQQQDYYTELMKKFGPKDICYAVLYDAKDADYISKLNPDILFQKLEEKYNDHPSLPEFITVQKADDVVTFPGLSYCMQLILGSQTTRFTFMCAGSSPVLANSFRQTLVSEASSRINMSTSGSMTSSLFGLRFVANFPASFQTITVTESGVNTLSVPNTGILLNRNVFSNVPITHVSGVTAFTLASRITFSAVTTWG